MYSRNVAQELRYPYCCGILNVSNNNADSRWIARWSIGPVPLDLPTCHCAPCLSHICPVSRLPPVWRLSSCPCLSPFSTFVLCLHSLVFALSLAALCPPFIFLITMSMEKGNNPAIYPMRRVRHARMDPAGNWGIWGSPSLDFAWSLAGQRDFFNDLSPVK